MKLEVSMAAPTRRQVTDAFKPEAVRLTRESGRPVAQVARELGIGDSLLYRWRNEQRQAEITGPYASGDASRAGRAHTA